MTGPFGAHYDGRGDLAASILERLVAMGKDPARITTRDLVPVDEFHIRGSKATLELAGLMALGTGSRVLDLGSGLGGPARTLVEVFGCDVTGIDLTPRFCVAARVLSGWVGLEARTRFVAGDATRLPFAAASFDAAMTIHVAMNIRAKDRLYAEARRVLLPGGRFAIYDVVQGEGGEVLYPVPWATDPCASHLVTRTELRRLVEGAGFTNLHDEDTTAASVAWFEAMRERRRSADARSLTLGVVMGPRFDEMTRNMARNLAEGRVRTLSMVGRR